MKRAIAAVVRWPLRQVRDLFVYWFLPFLAFLLPAGPSLDLLTWFSRRRWLFRERTEPAWTNAQRFQDARDEDRWKADFRMVFLLDAVDLWHGLFSSDRRILRSLVTVRGDWPDRDEGVVFIGVHLGTGTLAMRTLRSAGFRPRIIYRGALDRAILYQAPVMYLYMKLRIHYMIRVCGREAIPVGGASPRVRASIREPGVAVLLVVDAPVSSGSPHRMAVLGRELPVSRRGLDVLASERARFAFFTMVWDAATRRRVFTAAPAARAPESPEELLARCSAFLQDTLDAHGKQWQLWPVASEVLLEPGPAETPQRQAG